MDVVDLNVNREGDIQHREGHHHQNNAESGHLIMFFWINLYSYQSQSIKKTQFIAKLKIKTISIL